MSRGERAFNCMLGLSICSWAILGWLNQLPRPWLVQLVISMLHLTVGVLVLTRSHVLQHGSLAACAASVPSLIAAGLALRWAPADWNFPAQLVFAGAGFWTIVSLFCLGRSFAILPAMRATIRRGTYAFIRHPAYLGEIMMLSSCTVATWTWMSLAVLLVACVAIVWRIMAEERLMSSSPDYSSYKERVRWRLLPGIW